MPDWITHIVVAWTLCALIGFKFKQFNSANTAIVLLGALIPDMIKITMILSYFGINLTKLFLPIHTPVGSLIIASILSFLFREQKTALFLLIFGMLIHFALDILLIDLNGGIYLLYPFSWNQYQLELISNYDMNITLLSIIIASVVFLISYRINKKAQPVDS